MNIEAIKSGPECSAQHISMARMREFVYGKQPLGEFEFLHILGCQECLNAVERFKREGVAAAS